MTEIIEHRDRLGRVIKVGDFVAAADNNRLSVGTVCKLNPKMVQYKTIHNEKYWSDRRVNKYPNDVIVVEGPEVTFYILKNSGA
jgi:hypothetical protein